MKKVSTKSFFSKFLNFIAPVSKKSKAALFDMKAKYKMPSYPVFKRDSVDSKKSSLNSYFKNTMDSIKNVSFSRMSVKEQTFFIKRLSFLIKAGIPMLESLSMIQEQTRKKSHALIFKSIVSDVSRGQYLSTSLQKFNKMFGDFSINMISFGESTGMLSDNLEYLAEELKKKNELRKKMIGAFIYPALVTFATLGITGFLMLYLFPKIMPVFQSLRVELPLPTRIVMFFSNFLINYGLILFLSSVIILIVFLFLLKRVPVIRFYFDKFIMKIPAIGEVVKNYNLANITRTMGLLLKSGVTLGETLEIATKVSGNVVYKKEFENMAAVVNRGEQISKYLAKNRDLFPDVLSQIISVGERSGNLSNSLLYLSELYENEVGEFTKNISTLIEPVLMIVMGLMVGFIAISIITPIYGLTSHLSGK